LFFIQKNMRTKSGNPQNLKCFCQTDEMECRDLLNGSPLIFAYLEATLCLNFNFKVTFRILTMMSQHSIN
jgi:hypothetical protein